MLVATRCRYNLVPAELARMRSTSTVTIHLPSIAHNMSVIRDLVGPQCGVCAVVKADGYGLGAPRVAQQLAASGASMLAVYSVAQAEAIAEAGVALPMLVLMPVRSIEPGGAAHRLIITGRLHFTAHSLAHARDLAELAESVGGGALPIHVEVDTGMSRGGMHADEAARTIASIADDRRLRLAGVFTHFSESRLDPAGTAAQLAEFETLLVRCADSIPSDAAIHASNSHAVMLGGPFHKSMVRVGIAWTGLAETEEYPSFGASLEGVLSWTSSIVHTKEIRVGAPVGYGSRWRADAQTRVAVVPVGYFDGYPMGGASGRDRFVSVEWETPAGVQSRDAMVLGAVNMDQIVIDITSIPPSLSHAEGFVGMRVEVYGRDRARPNFLPRVAEAVGAHAYELLCRIHPRIPRQIVAMPTLAGCDEVARSAPIAVAGAIAS